MFRKYQLKNGMNVLLAESRKSPVLSIQMWVRTGSADEKKGEEGISHFIEHLVFKGSRQFKVGEMAAAVEAAGGEINAYTSFDQTVFYVTLSKQFEDVGLNVIAEMMGFPSFDSQEIDNEREVVIEEIKRSHDNLPRQASRLLFSTMYPKHPYGLPVIGFEENIRNYTREEILSYYNGRYNPANMTLVVAGDFSSADFKKKIEKNFGEFKPQKLRKSVRPKVKKQTKAVRLVQGSSFEEAMCHLAWRAPNADHKDIAALEVLALIFGQGESSRLYQKLRLEDACVHSIGASVFTAKDPGFVAISASLNPENLAQTLGGILHELEKILSEPPTSDEFTKAIINMSSEQFYSMETVDGLARKYGHFEDLFHDPLYFEKFLKQMQELTPKDVLKVARKYLTPKTMSMVILTPEAHQAAAKAAFSQFEKDFKKRWVKIGKKIPNVRIKKSRGWKWKNQKAHEQEIEKIDLPNGATLIVRPSFETPVVSVRLACLGGARCEPEKWRGGTELLSRVWTAGAGAYDEKSYNEKVDSLAAGISAFGGRHTIGLNLTALSPLFDEASDLFWTTFFDPHFSKASAEREVHSMIDNLRTRKDNPSQIAILNFMKSMFGDHPYGWDPYGSEQSLANLDGEVVRSLWSQTVSPEGLVVVASGAVDVGHWSRRLQELFKDWKKTAAPPPSPKLNFPSENQKIFEKSEKAQSHIVLGFPGLKITDERKYALQVLQSVLAGQGGRLFVELRDKASLAYSVAPLRMDGLDGGYFGAYIGCSPEKSKKAIEMLEVEFKKLQDTLIEPEELSRAQRYLMGRHDIELQRNSNITSSILFDQVYGIDYRDTYRFADYIREVRREDVQDIARELFKKPAVISVVGSEQPWS
jgi:zinc protease